WMAVAIKISHTHCTIAGQNSRPVRGTDANVVVEIPYPGLPRTGAEQEIIWMAVAIKISHTHYTIACRKSRPVRGTDANVVVEIPYLRLPCAGVEQEVIGMTVVVKVSWCRRGRIHQVVTDGIEIDAFRRCKSDVGRLACT